MLQSGIGFEALRGAQKCFVLKRTHVTQTAVELLARSELCKPFAARQQLET